jgi:membrane protease YdiL (CAAX protease family)
MVSGSHLPLYLILLGFEGALVLGTRALAARRGESVKKLIGRPFAPADLLIAAGMWVGWMGMVWSLNRILPSVTARVVGSMLPTGITESVLWVALSMSAGFAEEIAFRGYLQRRIGIIGQAIVFGVVHGYQGIYSVVRIAMYGLLFGLVAHWRKSLVPGMIAHAWTDIAAGLLRW